MQSKDIVLAFSGGLDTSFCVPYLQEQGWTVHTVFADTGGVDAEERAIIESLPPDVRRATVGVVRELAKMAAARVGRNAPCCTPGAACEP